MNKEYMLKKESVFPIIKNRKNFLLEEIPNLHPESAKYLSFWRDQKRKCIEGFWNIDGLQESDGYRYMPPNLYFYVNFGTILHKPSNAPRTAPKKKIRPHLRDLEWAFFYNYMEARGFSGFSDDDEYTSCNDIILYNQGKILRDDVHNTCFRKDGEWKTFITPRDCIRKIYDKPMGLPLYNNEAKNIMLLSSRGLGKSFLVGVGIVLFEILFDGARYYDEESRSNPAVAEVFVGAAVSSKSSELLKKVKDAMIHLPGKWAAGTDDEVPSPLYKDMSGSLEPNNMKNAWTHSYDKKIGGKWQKVGTGSHVYHGIFTTENPEAAAGTRPGIIIVEEVGLCPVILHAHGSNDAAQVTDGTNKFGSSIYIGTGGSIEKIVESEIIFRDPDGFKMLSFDDEWEGSGNICWFIPATYGDQSFKDENGNTILSRAAKHYEQRRIDAKSAKSKSVLDLEMMNFPLIPSEMFLNVGDNKFPIADLKYRYAELLSTSKDLDSVWKGFFRIGENGNPVWSNENTTPIMQYPLKQGDDVNGCIAIFEMPMKGSDGIVPYGVHIAGFDPVDDDDNSDIGRSLQSFWILNTITDRLVLEYSARTRHASEFYEQCRRALLFYNATVNYENQKKGFYAYMKNKNALHLLSDTPEILKDSDMQKSIGVGNKAHPYDQIVYTPNGIKSWGEIKKGDVLFGTNGGITTITDVPFDDYTDIYKITLQDGRSIEASDNHLWNLIDYANRNRVLSTNQIRNKYLRLKGKYLESYYYIPKNNGVEYKYNEIPIDPYLLGLSLGDGCFQNSKSNNIDFASCIDDIKIYSKILGFTYHTKPDKRHHSIRFSNFGSKLIELGLYNKVSRTKFIPNIYKYNTRDIRLNILRGLFDTDGNIGYGGNAEYVSTSHQLAVDVLEVARSLGINGNMNINNNAFGPVYKVRLYTNIRVFNLPRKYIRQKLTKTRYNKTGIVNIEYVGIKKSKCVTVDSVDNCYLIGEYITTHNSKGTSSNTATNRWGVEMQVEWMELPAYGVEGKTNLQLIKSPAYLRECILFDGVRNTDRVSSMCMLMIYREDCMKRTLSAKRNLEKRPESMSDKLLEHSRSSRLSYNDIKLLPNFRNTSRRI